MASKLNKEDAKVIAVTLITAAGSETLDLLDTKALTDDEFADPHKIIKALADHFKPKSKVTYERFVLNS